jgi:hypothetical protein
MGLYAIVLGLLRFALRDNFGFRVRSVFFDGVSCILCGIAIIALSFLLYGLPFIN